ncbi:MAG: trigger factor, partial [Candidatus Dormibacteria bacterium]
DSAINASLRRLAARVRIPGFRPGKAPAAMVERAVGWDTVRQDAVEHLVPVLYERALEQAGVEPVSEPQVNVDTLERDKPLTFTASVTVKPDVDLRDYHSITVEREHTEITDERVDEAIEDVRRRHAELIDVDRPAEAGDVLRATLTMRRGDEVLAGADSGERDLELDRGSVIPAIVDGIVGLRAGEERSFETTLPQDYPREELRGATVTVHASVHAVREGKLPSLDDALAVADGHGTTLDELREHYRERLTRAAEETDREKFESDVLSALRDAAKVEIPDAMVEREVERQLDDLEYRLGSIGIPLDKYMEISGQNIEQVRAERREPAVQRVKLDLALDALAQHEGVEVDESQVDREVRRVAEGRRLDASQRRRLRDIARRDLVRRAAAERMLEIAGGDASGYVET